MSLGYYSPGASIIRESLHGFIEDRPKASPGDSSGAALSYVEVAQADGMETTIRLYGSDPKLVGSRFRASFKMQFTYIHLDETGRILGEEPIQYQAMELLDVKTGIAKFLVLTEAGNLRLGTLNLATNAITWTDIAED